jgi:hypothetical protein
MDSKEKCITAQIKKHKQALMGGNQEISLTGILNSKECQRILSGCREFRDRIYTPIKTILTFIKQVLNPDKSCQKAVDDVRVEVLVTKGKNISTNTGPYCKARQRIPEKIVSELVRTTGQMASEKSLKKWKPYGRELKVFDGSTAKMADTQANQSEYPQVKNQKKGIGFPIVRFVVVMSLTIGTILSYAMGSYSGKGTGESSLLRSIFDCIKKDDIALGDRYFPNFFCCMI